MRGNNIPLSQFSGMPVVSSALDGWEIDIKVNRRRQQIVEGDIIYIDIIEWVRGTKQPLKSEEIQLKPDGQRSWSWYQIHITTAYEIMNTNQVIYIKDIPHKIMGVKDYSINGYNEYHCITDYE